MSRPVRSLPHRRPSVPLDYAMLHDARFEGRVIGRYAGFTISETLVSDGRRYAYVGIARRDAAGRLDPEQLRPGEFIAPPGLIYRVTALPRPRRILRRILAALQGGRIMLRDGRIGGLS